MRMLIVCAMMMPVMAAAQTLNFSATVVRVVPIHQMVTETIQNCVTETVTPVQRDASGAIIGAIVGGVVGNQIGKGSGQDIATAMGVIGGAIVGDNMKNNPTTQQRCTPVQSTRSVPLGYDVTWEFQGQQVTQRMSRDPGSTISVTVTAR